MLHELQVHQIELKMQNEELCRTQCDLEVLHARYFDLYDLAPVGYCTLNEKGLILEANITAADLLGVARGALVNQPLSRFILKEDLVIHDMLRKKLLDLGEPQACELRMVKKCGTVFWAHQKATVSEILSLGPSQETARAPEFRVIISDITVRKSAELNLKQMLEESLRLRKSLDQISSHAYMKDVNFCYVYANQPTLELFGCSAEELAGSDDSRFFPPGTAKLLREIDTRVLAGEHTAEEIEITDVKGGRRVYWQVKTPIYADNDHTKIWGLCGISTDITERKQAEIELNKKNTEMEQFIYTISHDLRSPLVTVKTFMGYLEKDMAEGNQEQLAQDIQFIHSAADKMKLMLDELLELSRIGRLETLPVRTSLVELAEEAMEALAGSISERKVDIHPPETDLMLFGDRPRLCQIWQNLIENAIRYSRDGSTPRIELGMHKESGETIFYVKDNGIGLEPRFHSKIFGIFDKLDPKSPGAGLGLSIVQRIVEKCGGRIWVESEGPDQGCNFRFTLPKVVHQEDQVLAALTNNIKSGSEPSAFHE